MVIVVQSLLLADAEVFEDVAEDFIGGDGFAEDGTEGIEGVAEVAGDEVGRKTCVEPFADAG